MQSYFSLCPLLILSVTLRAPSILPSLFTFIILSLCAHWLLYRPTLCKYQAYGTDPSPVSLQPCAVW